MKNKTIWEFFVKRYRFTYLIVLVAFVLGLLSIIQIPKESNPEVNIPYVVVNTPFIGASATEVEELVTDIIEDKLIGIEGVKGVDSTSREGFSSVVVEFDSKTSSADQKNKVQDKVDGAKSDLPSEAEDPIVTKIEASDEAVYIFSFSGPYNIIQLKSYAEELKEEIDRIGGVSSVNIVGGREREIKVSVRRASLDKYGLEIPQITSAVSRANANIPVGSIESNEREYNVRLQGKLFTRDDVARVPVGIYGGSPILVEDVADVLDSYADPKSISRLSLDGEESLPAVTISVIKNRGGNIIKLVDQIEEKIEKAKETYLPRDIKTEIILNMSAFIKEDLGNLFFSGLQTIILLFILLSVFVGFREALIASLAVPFSLLIAFIFLPILGFSLNFLSLFSLILALGILIDTSIVITERMNVLNKKEHISPQNAAIMTLREFNNPLIVGILTTIFAFMPMLIMSGIMGEYIRVIPITVTLVLLSSLFVGLALVPSVISQVFKREKHNEKVEKFFKPISNFGQVKFFKFLENHYNPFLSNILGDRKRKKRLVLLVLTLFVISMALPISGVLKVNMFPEENSDLFWIDVKKPLNVRLEDTDEVIKEIEKELLKDNDIKSFSSNVGSSSFGGGSGVNVGEIIINLKEDNSKLKTDYYQKLFDKTINANISVGKMSGGPPSSAPVDIALKGDNLDQLEITIQELKEILEEIPGSKNVKTSIEEPKGEFVFEIDRSKAELYGLSTIQIAGILRNAIHGSEATILRSQGEEVPVNVKYDLGDNITLGDLENITISTMRGDIPLANFTKSSLEGGRPVIRHEDGDRLYRLTSFTEDKVAPITIVQEFQKRVKDIELPDNVEISYGGEQQDIDQSFNDMFKAMIFAIFLIFGILLLEFASFRQPLFILTTIPLAFIGVFPGLLIMGYPLTFPAVIGIVALVGIVVNNGIIMIDMANNNRKEGMTIKEAIIDACHHRFRPIMLTTITTVVGIIPIALTSSLWGSLGFAIVFGLSVSSFFTLFFLPVLYLKFVERKIN